MKKIVQLDSIARYNELRGVETQHPLVSVIELSKAKAMPEEAFHFGLYAIYLKEVKCGDLKYGCNHYDYQEGTLVFVAPGQVVEVQNRAGAGRSKGWALVFHPDLLTGTPLAKQIRDYTFFSYEVHEALHLSERERQLVLDCFGKIGYELQQAVDKHSKALIAANIGLLLQYSSRFYDRQFLTRNHTHQGVLERFETLLQDYFSTGRPAAEGLPSVGWCARELHLSANYFGDLIRKETGQSAQEYIQSRVIGLAKDRIFDTDKSISEIAYGLGFKYPQHFTRLFKQKVGFAPNEYRNLN